MDLHHVVGTHRLLLNGQWEFAPGADGPAPEAGWRPVRVPHRSREFEDSPPTSGWYRTDLQVPAEWPLEAGRCLLDLGRVRHFGRAYLDGQVLGEHFHMRMPWLVDVGKVAKPGSVHQLTVFTHNCSGSYAHPDEKRLSEEAEKALDTRFWFSSAATVGMEGDVWLCLEPTVRLLDPYVVTSVREKSISLQITIANDDTTHFSGTVSWGISRQGQSELQLAPANVQVAPGDRQTVEVSAPWPNPILWGRPPYGEPVLYYLNAALDRSGETVDETTVPFGFREVWTEGDRLLLNGEQLMPWGDHTTPYVYERQWLTRKFQDLAEANISIVEHHRYDPPPVYYDVADELGIFVVGANFCVGTGQVIPQAADAHEREVVMASHLAVADVWLRRSRNHPSILFWDITDAREPAFCVPLLRKVKELDPTRIAEITFDPDVADSETVELIDCYRLFSGQEQIEAAINEIRTNPDLPVKPIRVGEAGIFTGAHADPEEALTLSEGWLEFLLSMPERNIHGLQTFFLADMDYRGFSNQIPGSLARPISPTISWPSQSGMDARIDPFGEGTQSAWGKSILSLNWCDPELPVSVPTGTRRWSQELFRKLTGRDVGPLARERIPEVIVEVERNRAPVAGAQIFVEALAGQGISPYGVRADGAGTGWFTLPESGLYRFSCGAASVELEACSAPVVAPAGYRHIQRIRLELPGP